MATVSTRLGTWVLPLHPREGLRACRGGRLLAPTQACMFIHRPVLGRGLLPGDPQSHLTASWEDTMPGRVPGRTGLEVRLCDLGQPPLPLWASFHYREREGWPKPTLKAQSPSSSSLEVLGSLKYPLDRNLPLKPLGPELVRGDEKTLCSKKLSSPEARAWGPGASSGTPASSSFLSLQQGQTQRLKGGSSHQYRPVCRTASQALKCI